MSPNALINYVYFTHSAGAPQEKKKPAVRAAAGEVWVDESLAEWPDNDYRLFVGDLAKEITGRY